MKNHATQSQQAINGLCRMTRLISTKSNVSSNCHHLIALQPTGLDLIILATPKPAILPTINGRYPSFRLANYNDVFSDSDII